MRPISVVPLIPANFDGAAISSGDGLWFFSPDSRPEDSQIFETQGCDFFGQSFKKLKFVFCNQGLRTLSELKIVHGIGNVL